MNKKRICLNCGGDIPPERQSGAKYCCVSCKARYHEKKLMKELFNREEKSQEGETKQAPPAAISPIQGLRGVVMNKPSGQTSEVKKEAEKAVQYTQSIPETEHVTQKNPEPDFIPVSVKVETEEYKRAKKEIEKLSNEINRVKGIIKGCDADIERIKTTNYSLLPLTTTIGGGLIGYSETEKNKNIVGLGSAVLGWGVGKLIDRFLFEKDREKETKEKIAKRQYEKTQWQKYLQEVLHYKKAWEAHILTIRQHETRIEMRPNLSLERFKQIKAKYENAGQKQLETKATVESGSEQPQSTAEPIQTNTIQKKEDTNYLAVETNEDLISNEQLGEMEFPCLDFQGKWQEFFGQPATIFHLAVHGRSGHGKSNFCFQLADYLADNFGNTVYISGEEGFSKTLKDKKIFNKVNSERIYWCRYKNFEAIKEKLKNQFNFIFLDSLDTLGIDAMKLRELRELFPESAIITISQSTKDGKMRGSNEILHDSDMAVKVEDGIAMTTKNRFKQSGKYFTVFAKQKPEKPSAFIQGNII